MRDYLDLKRGFFYAHISERRFGLVDIVPEPVFFIYNPHDIEEVRFQHRFTGSISTHTRETISQFHKQDDYEKGINFDEENKDVIVPTHYQVEASVTPFSAKTNVKFDVAGEKVHMMDFYLSPSLQVKEIFDESGLPLSFVKEKDSVHLIVFLNRPVKKRDRTNISMTYSGNIVERIGENFYIKSSGLWYPRHGYRTRAIYDLTFRTRKEFKFISIGKKVEDRKEGNYKITRWVQKVPIGNASFNLGSFKTYDMDVKGLPPITVFMSPKGWHQEIGRELGSRGILSGKDMEKQVGADIANK